VQRCLPWLLIRKDIFSTIGSSGQLKKFTSIGYVGIIAKAIMNVVFVRPHKSSKIGKGPTSDVVMVVGNFSMWASHFPLGFRQVGFSGVLIFGNLGP